MISVKVQCPCGQRYAFDVEPIHGRMPSPVACPVCGADGTALANERIGEIMVSQPATPPAGGIRIQLASPPARDPSKPPPIPSTAVSRQMARPVPQRPAPRPKATRGRDGWAKPEDGMNKLGSFITVGPGALAALISAGFLGIQAPTLVLCIVVAISGVVGGALNVAGRGPVLAGAIIGLVIAMGGYGAAWWWIHGRESVYTIEATIAFVVGALPGFLLQSLVQQVLRKRAGLAA